MLSAPNQIWRFTQLPHYAIVSKVTGKVLDVYGNLMASGTPIDIASAFGTSNQEWKLIPLGGQSYRILSNASGLAMDVFGAQTADGTPIDIATVVNGAPNQSWQVMPYDSQYYKIVSAATGKVLDVYHNLSADGTKVDIASWSGSDNQLWQLVQLPYYQITSLQSGKVLDVYGNQTVNGTPVDIAPSYGTDNQVWRMNVDGASTLPVEEDSPPPVLGVSSVAYIDETHISTYSATDVDYTLSAYYDSYVESCLYKDGSQLTCGSAYDNGGGTAEGYLNMAAVAGSYYQLITDHYVVSPIIVFVSGIQYYWNPYGLGYASGDGSYDTDIYYSIGAYAYLTAQYTYLGSTGIEAYTPLTAFNRGDLQDAATDIQYNGNGTYQITLTGPGWTTGLEDGFMDAATINDLPYCPIIENPLCDIYDGVKVLVRYGPIVGYTVLELWNSFHREIDSPLGWPGNDPNVGPAGWTSETQNGKPYYESPDKTKSLSPDLNNAKEGPHWDYNDDYTREKNWRIWPNGKMTPKRGPK